MVGIVSYGAYVPLRRLGKGTQGWRSPNEKAVAYYDEDSMTMAVAAAIDCLGDMDRQTVDGLYFASTTAPYKEKLAATTASVAVDLRRDALTADYGDTLRAGTGALRMAIDTVKAGSAKKVLVTTSDCRLGDPGGALDQIFGDGAAAFLIGDTDVIATLEAYYSVSNELFDFWRADTTKFVRTWEDRWVQEEGYMKVVPPVVAGFLEKYNLSLKDITKVALYGNNQRRHGQVAKAIGIAPGQMVDPLFTTVGNTGTAAAPMQLVTALENAKPGDTIMVVAYGDGCDVMLFKVTDAITAYKPNRSMKTHLAAKMIFPSYQQYFGFHHQSRDPDSGGGPAASVVAREVEQIYALRGTKCQACGTVQYPPQRVCVKCQTKDRMESFRLSDQRGTIYSRVLDYAAGVPAYESPAVNFYLDWHCGGRANFQLTDKKPNVEDVPMGMEVEMTFRNIMNGGGIHHYWWKAMPVRETWIPKEEK
jgi:hydroxymethylglutaryl-CoA synthase